MSSCNLVPVAVLKNSFHLPLMAKRCTGDEVGLYEKICWCFKTVERLARNHLLQHSLLETKIGFAKFHLAYNLHSYFDKKTF